MSEGCLAGQQVSYLEARPIESGEARKKAILLNLRLDTRRRL